MYRIFITYIFLLLLSCGDNEKQLYHVTYRVVHSSGESNKLFVSYKDTSGIVSFYTSDKIWKKEVSLPQGELASLLVQRVPDLGNDSIAYDCLLFDNVTDFVLGEIIHEGVTVWEKGRQIVMLDLLP